MKKIVVIAIAVMLLGAGVFSLTISLDDFFLTTKFYENPLSAYNAEAVYDALHGETKVEKQIGLLQLDDEKALFIGELSKQKFLIAEMNMKDQKFAHEGTVFFYDYGVAVDEISYNQTETKSGYINWGILFNQQDVDKLSNANHVQEYALSCGSPLFLVLFDQ